MSDDKTEEPTEKKLKDSRKEGKVARSRDLTDTAALTGALVGLAATAYQLRDTVHNIVTRALQLVHGDLSFANIIAQSYKLVALAMLAVLPCIAAAAIASSAAAIAQVGFLVSMKPITPNPEAINPIAGLKRIFSLRTLFDLVKMLSRGAILGIFIWKTIESLLPLIAGTLYQSLFGLGQILWQALFRLAELALGVGIIFGFIDFGVQRKLFLKEQKMSKDEVKREQKDQEGDPMIKGERRRLAREMATSPPPAKRTAGANMLVVNPTHYAVAIRYQPQEHPLPRVVAKGMDEAAAELRTAAREAGVPIISNPPVARELYKVAIDQPIPEALFDAVAAILRWLQTIAPDVAAVRDGH